MKQDASPLQKSLTLFGVILIIWSFYRKELHLPVWFDEFIAKPMIFIGPIFWYITSQEKTNFLKGIWFKSKNLRIDLLISVGIGLLLIATIVTAKYLKTGSISGLSVMSATGIIFLSILTLTTAFSEEIISRGFVVKRLYEDSKNIYTSTFGGAGIFLVLHIPSIMTNASLSGSTLLIVIAMDIFLGLINSFIFLDRRSLIPPILIHAFYNLAILLYI